MARTAAQKATEADLLRLRQAVEKAGGLACNEKRDAEGAEHARREHILSSKDETARGVRAKTE